MIPVTAFAACGQAFGYSFWSDVKLLAGLCLIILVLLTHNRAQAQDTIPRGLNQQNLQMDTLAADSLNNEDFAQPPGALVVTSDSVLVGSAPPTEHSPLKATMLSATLPGLGQIYNGKYWKVPIIYAAYGGVAYALNFNNTNYQRFRRAWVARVDGNPNTTDEFPRIATDRLLRATNYYRRNLELTYIVAAAVYVLNILDATVDAHLLDFDVGDDLSMKLSPAMMPAGPGNGISQGSAAGVTLSFRF